MGSARASVPGSQVLMGQCQGWVYIRRGGYGQCQGWVYTPTGCSQGAHSAEGVEWTYF